MHAFVYVRVDRLRKDVSKIFVQYSLPFFVLVLFSLFSQDTGRDLAYYDIYQSSFTS